jgi:hypothetical protein
MNQRGDHRIELQARDVALLCGLLESRVMKLRHIALLHFDGRAESAKQRVYKLKAAGLLTERPRRAYEPAVLCLSRRGFEALAERGCLDRYPPLSWRQQQKRGEVSEFTLRHELAVMDVKSALVQALSKRQDVTVAEFTTWPVMNEFTVSLPRSPLTTVKPDGFLRIHEERSDEGVLEHAYFLEIDLSTETTETVSHKAECYRAFYRSGGFARRCGGQPDAYAEYPFLVLVVCPSAERRNNLAEGLLLLSPPINTQVWLTTFAEMTVDPLGAVWVQPKDYREVTAGTPYAPQAVQRGHYRSRPDREAFIESHIRKSLLLPA